MLIFALVFVCWICFTKVLDIFNTFLKWNEKENPGAYLCGLLIMIAGSILSIIAIAQVL